MATGNLNSFDRKILSVALLLLLVFGYLLYDDHLIMNWASAHGPKVAEIQKTKDDVRLKFADDFRWSATKRGIIHMGDSIFTGPGSEATIELNDKSVIKIEENSLIVFNTSGDKLSIVLKQGHMNGDLAQVHVENLVEKRAPAAIPQVIDPRPVIRFPHTYLKKELHLRPDGSFEEEATSDIRWTYDKSLVQFEVQISKDPQFGQFEKVDTTKELSLKSPPLDEGSHFVRVREMDEKNPKTRWSKVSQIEVVYIHPKVNLALTAPIYKKDHIEQAVNEDKPVLLEWNPVKGAQSYIVEVSNDPTLKQPKVYATEKTSLVVKNPDYGKTYFRVTAISPQKEVGPPGIVGQVKLEVKAPKLLDTADKRYWAKSPEDDCPPTDFSTQWKPIPTVPKYLVQVANNAEFKSPMKYETTEPKNNVKVDKPGQYFWRVQPITSSGVPLSDFSAPSSFKYLYDHPLATPRLIEPAENMTLFFQKKTDIPFFLTWKKSKDSREYALEVATDPDFKNVVVAKNSTANQYLLTDNIPRGDLYWRVRASNGSHTSAWSSPRKMTVLAGRTATGL